MTDDRANIKVSREWYNEHNPKRKKLGATWEEYAAGNAPDAGLPDDVREQLDRIEAATTTTETRTGTIDKKIDELGGGR